MLCRGGSSHATVRSRSCGACGVCAVREEKTPQLRTARSFLTRQVAGYMFQSGAVMLNYEQCAQNKIKARTITMTSTACASDHRYFYSVSPFSSSPHPRPRPRPLRPLLPALAPKQRARPLPHPCRQPSCLRRRRVCSRRSAALRVVAIALARARAGLCALRSRFLRYAL